MLGFQNFDFLTDCTISEDDILILFSQPSAEESKQISTIEWFRVFAHVGIRFPATPFDARSFVARIEEAERAVMEHRKRSYLSFHADAGTDERAYLERISGLTFPDGRGLRGSGKSNSEDHRIREDRRGYSTAAPCKFTVFLGEDEDFLTFYRKMRSVPTLWIDGDLLRPSFDELFGIRKISTGLITHLAGANNTGLNALLDAIAKDLFRPEFFRRVTKKIGHRQEILLGNYNIYNYEYYNEQEFHRLIDGALAIYSSVVWRAQPFPYDRISLAALHRADCIVIMLPSDVATVRYWHHLYRIYTQKQGIPEDRIHVFSRKWSTKSLVLPYLFGTSYRAWGSGFRRATWA